MPSFDRIVVISLRRRQDRQAAFLDRFRAAMPDAVLDLFDAVDGELAPPPDWWRGGPGAWGCYRSHQRVLEEAASDGLASVLVFEDDATFVGDFAGRLAALWSALPQGGGQIYLGGQHLRDPVDVNDLLVRCVNTNRTHAYAVCGSEWIRSLYRWLHAGVHWRGRHHVDHHYGRQHQTGVPTYAPRDWLCGQAAGNSDICRRAAGERWWQRGHATP